MTDELLENIIQLEKRIQAEVADERVRAKSWEEHELAILERSCEETRSNEEMRCQQALAAKKESLLHEVATLEAKTSSWCKRLSDLEDAILRDLLKQHLAAILPGGDHDHPHGQG